MMTRPLSGFDSLASRYDELWTNAPAGRLQREAVWRNIESLFQEGQSVLDLGCGTGEDARWLSDRGVRVLAIDASPEMVEQARRRDIDAHIGRIEEIAETGILFSGILSNFGAFNCVADPAGMRERLATLVVPGGCLVLCTIGRFCLWETIWYSLTGKFTKASRRWRGKARAESLGLDIYYHSVRHLRKCMAPQFELVSFRGIGIAIPPSFVSLPRDTFRFLAAADRMLERLPLLSVLADHRLTIFIRK